MLVKHWMNKNVVTVDVNDSMSAAVRIMKENKIRRLPVTKKGKLVGIVTDRDIKRASASDATSLEIHELLYLIEKISVKEIMTKTPITVFSDLTIEETAEILLKNKISGAPVLDRDGRLVGVITQSDIFKVLISITGLAKRGIQFALQVEDKKGAVQEIIDIFRGYGGRILNILTTQEQVPGIRLKLYVRMHSIDRNRFDDLKKELRKKAQLIYMVDYREGIREVYIDS